MSQSSGAPAQASSNAQLQLRDLLLGFVVSRSLQVAAELGIADALADGPKTCELLAQATSARVDTLRRLLRLLVSYGVFAEQADGRYANTATSECLRDDAAGSLRGLARMYGDIPMWQAWEGLLHSVRTGDPSFLHVHGTPVFDYLSAHQDSAQRFDQAMVSSSELLNPAIVQSYDWTQFGTLVDVAGGAGSTLAAILEATPKLQGVLFDLPHVVERSREYLTKRGVLPRCRLESGSFFDALPAGADAYFMKHIIHDWADADCLRILRNCRAAMPDHANLLLCEKVIPPGGGRHYGKITDVVMLAMTDGGRERTEQEYRDLLAKAGLRLTRVVSTPADNSLIEAVKA